MIRFSQRQIASACKFLEIMGLCLLLIACLLFLSAGIGITTWQSLEFFGHSGIRTVAAIAVLGCLSAAIGYHDE